MFDAFYSDPHFGHKKIIEFCDRPFANLEEMHEEFIQRYNEVAYSNLHNVLWVGDCFLRMNQEQVKTIMGRLKGRKGLVIGNHDRSKYWMASVGFDFVVDQMTMRIANRKVLVCHYPYADYVRSDGFIDKRYLDKRPRRQKGEVLIHGHTHDPRRRNGNQIHVGVDAWAYGPAPYPDVMELIEEV